jgi:hypothetical protein
MPKKSVVASFVGNLSPVKRRSAILVRSTRHFRGDMGDELKRRAGTSGQRWTKEGPQAGSEHPTILEDRSAIQFEAGMLGILVLLCVAHLAWCLVVAGESGVVADEDAPLELVCNRVRCIHGSSIAREKGDDEKVLQGLETRSLVLSLVNQVQKVVCSGMRGRLSKCSLPAAAKCGLRSATLQPQLDHIGLGLTCHSVAARISI